MAAGLRRYSPFSFKGRERGLPSVYSARVLPLQSAEGACAHLIGRARAVRSPSAIYLREQYGLSLPGLCWPSGTTVW